MLSSEIYYYFPEKLGSVEKVTQILEELSLLFSVPRWKLGVFSSGKGLFWGKTSVSSEFKEDAWNIVPSLMKNPVESTAQVILILEKDTLLEAFISSKFKDILFENVILVTGRGYPDLLTRLFVRHLSENSPIRLFYLGDLDPHGLEIYLTYLCGSRNTLVENPHINLPFCTYLGLYQEWIRPYSNEIRSIQLSSGDVQKNLSLADHPVFLTEKEEIKFSLLRIQQNMAFIQENQVKIEIEQFFEVVEKSEFILEVLCEEFNMQL